MVNELWEKVKENSRKRRDCTFHEFMRITWDKYKCIHCDCAVDSNYVTAYIQGFKHGKEGKHEECCILESTSS